MRSEAAAHARLKGLVGELRARLKGEFREDDHPRGQPGNAGQFAEGQGGGGGGAKPEGAAKPKAPANPARFHERGAEQAGKHYRRIRALLAMSEQGKIDGEDLADQTRRAVRAALRANEEIFADLENFLYERADAEMGREALASEEWAGVRRAIGDAKRDTDLGLRAMGRVAMTYADWPDEGGGPRRIQAGDKEDLKDLHNGLVSAYDAAVGPVADAWQALAARFGRGKSRAAARLKGGFREEDHPRDEEGRFGEGQGGGGGATADGGGAAADFLAEIERLSASYRAAVAARDYAEQRRVTDRMTAAGKRAYSELPGDPLLEPSGVWSVKPVGDGSEWWLTQDGTLLSAGHVARLFYGFDPRDEDFAESVKAVNDDARAELAALPEDYEAQKEALGGKSQREELVWRLGSEPDGRIRAGSVDELRYWDTPGGHMLTAGARGVRLVPRERAEKLRARGKSLTAARLKGLLGALRARLKNGRTDADGGA